MWAARELWIPGGTMTAPLPVEPRFSHTGVRPRNRYTTRARARVRVGTAPHHVTVVMVEGDLDVSTVVAVETTLLSAVATAAGHLVLVDLNAVQFLSTSAVALLLDAEARARHGGWSLRLICDERSPAARTLRRVVPLVHRTSTRTDGAHDDAP